MCFKIMSNKMDQVENMVFQYETTHRSDFKDIQLLPATEKVKTIKGLRLSTAEKDFEKLTEPKETSCFLATESKIERGRRSIPRVLMPPAVNVDDIEDPRVRQILIKDVYTSSSRRSYNQPINIYQNSANAPLPSRYTPNNPIALPEFTPQYVTPEWRLESAGWDRKQRRAFMERNKVFWQSQDIMEEADKKK